MKIHNKNKVMSDIAKRYNIIRIRMKISYMAYIGRETIFERFFKAILKSYNQLKE